MKTVFLFESNFTQTIDKILFLPKGVWRDPVYISEPLGFGSWMSFFFQAIYIHWKGTE